MIDRKVLIFRFIIIVLEVRSQGRRIKNQELALLGSKMMIQNPSRGFLKE